MSYQPGKMGYSECIVLVVMATIPRIFLTGLPRLMEGPGQFAWLTILLSGFITTGMIFLLISVVEKLQGDLVTISQKLWGRIGAWVVGLYYCIFSFANSFILIRQYAENTLLTALPEVEFSQALLWYVVPACILIYLGIEGMARAMWVLLPFITFSFAIVWALIYPYWDFYNLLPVQANGLDKAFHATILAAGFDVGAIIVIVLAPSFQNDRCMRIGAFWGLLTSSLLKSITCFIYILVFGVYVGQEKILPFFELSRLVYLSRYLQHIEALFILTWVISGVITVSLSMYLGIYLLARLVNLPTLRPLIPTVGLILTYLAMMPPSIINVIRLDQQWVQWSNLGVYVIPGLLYITYLWKTRKRSKTCVQG